MLFESLFSNKCFIHTGLNKQIDITKTDVLSLLSFVQRIKCPVPNKGWVTSVFHANECQGF